MQKGACKVCNECFEFRGDMKCDNCCFPTTHINYTGLHRDTGSPTSISRTILTGELHYGLQRKIEEEIYFFDPCMFQQESPKELISPELDPQMVSTSVLCYVFTRKYLQPPIFHRRLPASIAHCSIAKKKTSENLIFCDCCVFNIDFFHSSKLCFKNNVVSARITRMVIDKFKTHDAVLSTRIIKFITLNLSKMTSYLDQNLNFEVHVQCPPFQCVPEYGINPCQEWLEDEMENLSMTVFLLFDILRQFLISCVAHWPIANEDITYQNKRKLKIGHRLLKKQRKGRHFYIVHGNMDFFHCERTMNRSSILMYRKRLDYITHGQQTCSRSQTLSQSSSWKLRLILDYFTHDQRLSQRTHMEILDHLCNGQEMSMISYYRFKRLFNTRKQYPMVSTDALGLAYGIRYNPVLETKGKVTQELIGPGMVKENDTTIHSLRSNCLIEEEAQYVFQGCCSNSNRLTSACAKDPKLSASEYQESISMSVPVNEDLPRHKKKIRSLVLHDLNVSERYKGDLLLTCKQTKLENAIKFANSVQTSITEFFTTRYMIFDIRGNSNETALQFQYGVDEIPPEEKGSAEIDERNARDIDLKENKKSVLHSTICPSLSHLPQPSLSRDAIVGFIEGQSHAELGEILKQLASDEIPEPRITMKYDMLRLCTMKTFPGLDRPFATRITGAGFYYAGHQDQVICYCCGSRKDNWVRGDIPLLIHQNMAPNCCFLTDNVAVNVPVSKTNSTKSVAAELRLLAIQRSDGSNQSDTAQGESSLMRPSSEQSQVKVSSGTHQMLVTSISMSPNQLMSSRGQNVLNSQQTPFAHADSVEYPPPKYPQYAVKTMRTNSFQGWSAELRQKPEEMAECGFYYAGFSDCVRCFYCGVGLRHWMSEDDPWIEHARWSTSCIYVRKMKGEEFVNLVKMAVEIAEREEESRNNSGANQPTQNNTRTAPATTVKEV